MYNIQTLTVDKEKSSVFNYISTAMSHKKREYEIFVFLALSYFDILPSPVTVISVLKSHEPVFTPEAVLFTCPTQFCKS